MNQLFHLTLSIGCFLQLIHLIDPFNIYGIYNFALSNIFDANIAAVFMPRWCGFVYYLLEATYCVVFHRKEALPLYIQMTTVAFVVVLSIMTEVCIIVSYVYDSSVLTNAVNLLVLAGVESVCILIFELGVHHLKKEITTIQTQQQQFAMNTTPEFNETSANPKNPSSTSCFDYWRTSLQCSCDYKN